MDLKLTAKISVRIIKKKKKNVIAVKILPGLKLFSLFAPSTKGIIPPFEGGPLEINLDKRNFVRLRAFTDRDNNIRVNVYQKNKEWIKYQTLSLDPDNGKSHIVIIDPLKKIAQMA
ncbi:hypothetical protein A2303_01930 [Candidatus Falkowbacteria bacterium RIFOXYB2_FULL_47_14]|uniref:Uncharacterized protein n=1 Tax=Candidatus Falkowbacteria bacterium RIFOXYA2_FULL_47_19 TaxID=1797994 RepID=A0A1F5SNA5_9BACT|nr:MAG: hypothetical protein A2227_06760 [Candidatus Falkowbacteria bacterium RIFOXYA2_FULL_47_19]OGF34594.1 MAG: hypothetical protein A2468_07830 [Candidatus Falkowbacteria bacterium RIFOXYC2_FULL_46_15]OGF43212.1 MAG: hypothetical protein A2303_01930 [Candidatus Falkowbacteria bacterium RIFOXYB2_FULL_47_14]